VQLDGCRIPPGQYDALLGRGLNNTHRHSNAAISPAVADPIQDVIDETFPSPKAADAVRTSQSEVQQGREHAPCSSQPVAEAMDAEESYTGLVVDPSLVDVQSSEDSGDEMCFTVVTRDAPGEHGGQAAAEQSSEISALTALQQAQKYHASTSACTSLLHEHHAQHSGGHALATTPGSSRLGILETRQLSEEATFSFEATMHIAASGGWRTQQMNSRESHLSSEDSTAVLAGEGSSTDEPESFADLSHTVSMTCEASSCEASQDEASSSAAEAGVMQLHHAKFPRFIPKAHLAAIRHRHRLDMIATGQAVLGTDIGSQEFSLCPAVLDDQTLAHALAADMLPAALKYNPLFAVMHAAVKLQLNQKDRTATVCIHLFISAAVRDESCAYGAFAAMLAACVSARAAQCAMHFRSREIFLFKPIGWSGASIQ
jgi:hypothetical protein